MDKKTAALRKMEWSGQAACAPYSMGGSTPYYLRCCPLCGGIDPSSNWKGEFIEEAIGHRPDCPYSDPSFMSP